MSTRCPHREFMSTQKVAKLGTDPFVDTNAAQANGILATKALACKLAKAAWHMMSKNTRYDAGRMFPGVKK